MIVSIALNATLRVTYETGRITCGGLNHVSRVNRRAGGEGLAVARVLASLGEDVLVGGFAGGASGSLIEADLGRAGITSGFTTIGQESRRVVDVLDEAREQVTTLAEPSPFITTEELGLLATSYRTLLQGCAAVVLSGGLPAGLPTDSYASLARYAAEAGVPAVVHAGGLALWQSLPRRPALAVTQAASGPAPGSRGAHAPGPGELLARGAQAAAVVTGDTVFLATPDGRWRASLEGYPGLVLSAEAVTAGLLPGAAQGWTWPDALRNAVALGAAADPSGEVDLDAYELLSSEVALGPGE